MKVLRSAAVSALFSGIGKRLRTWLRGGRSEGVQPSAPARPPAAAAPPPSRLAPPAGLAAAALAALDEALIILDERLRVVWMNEAAADLVPLAQPGRDIRLYLRALAVGEALARLSRRRAGSEQADFPFDDRRLSLAATWITEGEGTGANGAILVILRDLTAIVRAERMRGDFVANVSHELKTPLAALIGFIETLMGPARDDAKARARFLTLMEAEARRMDRLVSDLLALSRLESEPPLAADARADLAAVVRRVVELMAPIASQARVPLESEIEPAHAPVRGEEDRLVQMLTNLVDNAVKYGKPGPVTVSLRREGGEWLLAVRDRGPGIAPEHLPRLTERFYRVDSARSRAMGGTGLGLALVKHILRRHGGRLEITSQPGAGTTVVARLPAVAGAA